jgi:hypothetical protein
MNNSLNSVLLVSSPSSPNNESQFPVMEYSKNGKPLNILTSFNLSSIKKDQSTVTKSFQKIFNNLTINANPEYDINITTENTQQIEVSLEEPYETHFSDHNPLIIIRCKKVTTYYVDNYMFSVLTHPESFEQDFGVPSVFIKPRCNGYNIKDFSSTIIGERLDTPTLNRFVENLNEIYITEEIKEISELHVKKVARHLIISAVFLVVAILLFVLAFTIDDLLFKTDGGVAEFWIKLVFFLLILLLILYFFFKYMNRALIVEPQNKRFNVLNSRVENYENIQDYLDNWNKYIFLEKKFYVSIPLNFEYVHVVLDITKDVRIKNHNLKE